MADQVDEVKQKSDIVAIIGERIELKRAGRNYKALCPFHSEKTPSFMVSAELQMFKCFGCMRGGDVFTFLQEFEGMDFPEALKYLADRVGVKLVSYRPGEESEKERLFQLNSLASRFYNYVLLNHKVGKPALNYLTQERGLTEFSIKTFGLGFSPDSENALSKFLVGKKKFNPNDLEKAGLAVIKGGTIFDRFRGRAIFPLFDHRGNVVGFSGRLLPWVEKDLAKYINSPETSIYHKGSLLYGLNLTRDEIKKENCAIVVEGELDLISSWQAGIKNIVAIKGSALTEDQVRLLSRFTKKIIFALDSDFAGDVAARRGISIAQNSGFELTVARLGKYKDPDEAARGDSVFYKKALSESIGVWDFLIGSIFLRNDAKTGEGKGKISREIVPVLTSISDKIVQAHYIEKVARKLGVPSESVSEQLSNVTSKERKETLTESVLPKPLEKTRRQLLEERLLALAFQSDPKILLEKETSNLVATPLTKRILEEFENFSKNNLHFSLSLFTEKLPKELVNGFSEIVLKDTEEVIEDPERLSKEYDLVKHELKIVDIRHKLEVAGVKIREYEDKNEEMKLKEAQVLFGELSKQLSELERLSEAVIILKEP